MDKLKAVIPMAGIGKRLQPLTLTKPKPLISVAGKRLLDYVLDTFEPLRDCYELEYIFIIGYLGNQIKEFMQKEHPKKKVKYYVQEEMRGQSHALWLAREDLTGQIAITYCDTLIRTDVSCLNNEKADGVMWVKEVEDPRRFGIAKVGQDGYTTELIEKPNSMENRLALSGLYYIKEGKDLVDAIAVQMSSNEPLKGEYYLADALNVMIQQGKKFRVEQTEIWLDAGTPETLIETNGILLESSEVPSFHGKNFLNSAIIPPVFIHDSATIENSVIGPNVSIAANCMISKSIIRNSIIDEDTRIVLSNLENSLIGKDNDITTHSVTLIEA